MPTFVVKHPHPTEVLATLRQQFSRHPALQAQESKISTIRDLKKFLCTISNDPSITEISKQIDQYYSAQIARLFCLESMRPEPECTLVDWDRNLNLRISTKDKDMETVSFSDHLKASFGAQPQPSITPETQATFQRLLRSFFESGNITDQNLVDFLFNYANQMNIFASFSAYSGIMVREGIMGQISQDFQQTYSQIELQGRAALEVHSVVVVYPFLLSWAMGEHARTKPLRCEPHSAPFKCLFTCTFNIIYDESRQEYEFLNGRHFFEILEQTGAITQNLPYAKPVIPTLRAIMRQITEEFIDNAHDLASCASSAVKYATFPVIPPQRIADTKYTIELLAWSSSHLPLNLEAVRSTLRLSFNCYSIECYSIGGYLLTLKLNTTKMKQNGVNVFQISQTLDRFIGVHSVYREAENILIYPLNQNKLHLPRWMKNLMSINELGCYRILPFNSFIESKSSILSPLWYLNMLKNGLRPDDPRELLQDILASFQPKQIATQHCEIRLLKCSNTNESEV